MGLDMYLTKEVYLGRDYDDERKNKKIKLQGWQRTEEFDTKDIIKVILDVGYWKKANAIHRWFVDNIQSGVDDCEKYCVPESKLEELLSIVNTLLNKLKLKKGKIVNGKRFYKNNVVEDIIEKGYIIENKEIAEELLPTQKGFFFGNTDYNQYYYDDLKYTKQILTKALSEKDKYNVYKFYYQSSW